MFEMCIIISIGSLFGLVTENITKNVIAGNLICIAVIATLLYLRWKIIKETEKLLPKK